MRRIILIGTAVAVLIGASAAYAALNNYAGSGLTFSKGSGSKSKPVGVSFTETLKAANTDSTKAAAVLTHITVKIYGLVSNAKSFPTCSATKMMQLKSDSFCPKASKFASGAVNSILGDPSLKLPGTPCNPGLDVFNAGGNKLWFFFTTDASHVCAGGALHTGDTAPYPGTVKQVGKYQITDVPLPSDISTAIAGHAGTWGSLIKQTLTWYKVSTKVKGKTVYNNVSVGCLKGKRPWTITFKATADGGKTFETKTVSGSTKC